MPPSPTDEVNYNPKSMAQLSKSHQKPKKVLCVIGPEGDFTPQEKTHMCEVGTKISQLRLLTL